MVPGTTSPPHTPCKEIHARARSIGQDAIAFPTLSATEAITRPELPGKEV